MKLTYIAHTNTKSIFFFKLNNLIFFNEYYKRKHYISCINIAKYEIQDSVRYPKRIRSRKITIYIVNLGKVDIFHPNLVKVLFYERDLYCMQ